jgi:hypothetical protein
MEPGNYLTVISSLVASLLSGVGGYLTARATIKKAEAETIANKVKSSAEAKSLEASAEKTVGEAWAALYSELRRRVDDQDDLLEKQDLLLKTLQSQAEAERDSRVKLEQRANELESRVSELETENRDLRTWGEELVAQLKVAQVEPAPFVRTRKGK